MSTSIPPESSSNISTEDALPSKPPPAPPAVPKLTLENPLVSLSQLRSAPSQRDGVPKILENDLRLLGCELIQKAGILLRLPQIAMSTAQILLQRFYFVASMRKYAVRDIAMGAVFLACKVEETPRRIRDIVNVFHYLIQDFRKEPKNEVLDMFGEGFYEMKDALLRSEMHLLKRLAFNVHVQNGYGVMINYLRVLKLLERDDATEIAQKAWNYLNDSLRTIVWVLYQPSAIACAAIFLASREFEISLPSIPVPNSEESVLWCELFETEEKDLYIISAHILSLYHRPLRRDLPVTLAELERFLKRKEGVEELLKKDRIEIDEQQYEIMIQEKIKKEERERLAREEAAKRAREEI
ncbi:cyclin-like protein [Paraphysoderma sedebokerense]|nr:cyclin-like protein [Paraphysoderma sedebokerense]